MFKCVGITGTSALFVCYLFAIPLIVFSFIYSNDYSDADCSSDALLHVSKWHLGFAIESCIVLGLLGLGLTSSLFGLCISKGCIVFGMGLDGVVLFCDGLFTLAWVIIGGIVLFRDSMDCLQDEQSLWIYTLVLWILQLLGVIYSFGGSGGTGSGGTGSGAVLVDDD